MGFAKYHEDNMKIWEERNRYKDRQRMPVSINQSRTEHGKSIRNQVATISAQSTTKHSDNTVYCSVPHRF
jgi:hypothetical protein